MAAKISTSSGKCNKTESSKPYKSTQSGTFSLTTSGTRTRRPFSGSLSRQWHKTCSLTASDPFTWRSTLRRTTWNMCSSRPKQSLSPSTSLKMTAKCLQSLNSASQWNISKCGKWTTLTTPKRVKFTSRKWCTSSSSNSFTTCRRLRSFLLRGTTAVATLFLTISTTHSAGSTSRSASQLWPPKPQNQSKKSVLK